MSAQGKAALFPHYLSPAGQAPARQNSPLRARLRAAMYIGAIFLAVIGLTWLLHLDSEGGVQLLNLKLPDLCLFHALTGLDCPGCGITRSFIALLHLDFARAFSFNWAGPLVFLLLACHLSARLLGIINPTKADCLLRSKALEGYLKFVVIALLFAWAVKIFRQF